MPLLWLVLAAHAGPLERLQAQVQEGRADDARKQCTAKGWHAADADPEIREVCAKAFRIPLQRSGTADQWMAFSKTWEGTSAAFDAVEQAADSAMSLASDEAGWSIVVERYPGTDSARIAGQRLVEAALVRVGNSAEAADFVRKYPRHQGADRLLFDYPNTFFTLEPGPKLTWKDAAFKRRVTVTWAVVAPRGRVYTLADGVRELMSRHGFSDLALPGCAPGAPWRAGVQVSTLDYNRVFDHLKPEICKGDSLLMGIEGGKVTYMDAAPLAHERGTLRHPEGEILLPEAPGTPHGSDGRVLQAVGEGIYLSTPLAECLPARVKAASSGVPIEPRAADGERALPAVLRLALDLSWTPSPPSQSPSEWSAQPPGDAAQAMVALDGFGVQWQASTAQSLGDGWWLVGSEDGFGTAVVGPDSATLLAGAAGQVQSAAGADGPWLRIGGVVRRLERGHWCRVD